MAGGGSPLSSARLVRVRVRSFEDGLRLVKLRGESMQAAADAAKSGMVSVIGLDSAKVAELCKVGAGVGG